MEDGLVQLLAILLKVPMDLNNDQKQRTSMYVILITKYGSHHITKLKSKVRPPESRGLSGLSSHRAYKHEDRLCVTRKVICDVCVGPHQVLGLLARFEGEGDHFGLDELHDRCQPCVEVLHGVRAHVLDVYLAHYQIIDSGLDLQVSMTLNGGTD